MNFWPFCSKCSQWCIILCGSTYCSCFNPAIFQVVEDGYEFFAKRQLVTLFSAPNYCGEFDNAGGMMSVDESLMCSFQILKPSEKKAKYQYGGVNAGRPVTPPRTAQVPKKRWAAGSDSPALLPVDHWPNVPAGCLKQREKKKTPGVSFACSVGIFMNLWFFSISYLMPWSALTSCFSLHSAIFKPNSCGMGTMLRKDASLPPH